MQATWLMRGGLPPFAAVSASSRTSDLQPQDPQSTARSPALKPAPPTRANTTDKRAIHGRSNRLAGTMIFCG
jgi:hypothetical protein